MFIPGLLSKKKELTYGSYHWGKTEKIPGELKSPYFKKNQIGEFEWGALAYRNSCPTQRSRRPLQAKQYYICTGCRSGIGEYPYPPLRR